MQVEFEKDEKKGRMGHPVLSRYMGVWEKEILDRPT